MSNIRARRINKNITEGKLSSSLWKLATPIMMASLLQDLFTLADFFLCGKIRSYSSSCSICIRGYPFSNNDGGYRYIFRGYGFDSPFYREKDYTNADRVLFQVMYKFYQFSRYGFSRYLWD